MFKVLIGRQAKGGSTYQQAESVELAALDLERQLNDKKLGVQNVQGVIVHDINPLSVEVIAVVEVSTPALKKGE